MMLAFAGSAIGAAAQDDLPTVTIGSKDFTEQILVSEMLAQLLEDAGYPVERELNLGGSLLVHQALVSGEIDAYVDYSGTLWANTLGRSDAPPRSELLAQLTSAFARVPSLFRAFSPLFALDAYGFSTLVICRNGRGLVGGHVESFRRCELPDLSVT